LQDTTLIERERRTAIASAIATLPENIARRLSCAMSKAKLSGNRLYSGDERRHY
jgi:hypothetical protein